jgi:RNA polymerase sigma-70 factor (ECF subfamily)
MNLPKMVGTPELRNESAMIASILGGETHLFHELVRPYERSVYVMALSFLHNEADAEDAAQEAFLKAFRNLSRFRGESKFGTWLISITLNEARSRLRRAKTVTMESLDEPPDGEGHLSPALLRDWREIPSDALERQEMRQMLQQAVAELSPIYREIFLLREVEELSISEAAEVLQISEVSVKVRLHRARMMLQKTLAPRLKQLQPKQESKRRWLPWS